MPKQCEIIRWIDSIDNEFWFNQWIENNCSNMAMKIKLCAENMLARVYELVHVYWARSTEHRSLERVPELPEEGFEDLIRLNLEAFIPSLFRGHPSYFEAIHQTTDQTNTKNTHSNHQLNAAATSSAWSVRISQAMRLQWTKYALIFRMHAARILRPLLRYSLDCECVVIFSCSCDGIYVCRIESKVCSHQYAMHCTRVLRFMHESITCEIHTDDMVTLFVASQGV